MSRRKTNDPTSMDDATPALKQFIELRLGKQTGEINMLKEMLARSFGSASFHEFWRYWNPVYGYYLYYKCYKPLRRYLPHPWDGKNQMQEEYQIVYVDHPEQSAWGIIGHGISDYNTQHAYLDTFSFQAPDFYKRHGYQVFGELSDFPPGHQRYYLTKQL